tara:strand:- start:73 stop:552 length:480 start_codon:yes stop_codon:yes gene_type:complete
MKKALITMMVFTIALSGCVKRQAPEPEVEDLPIEEEIPEAKDVEDLPEEAFKRVRYHIQEQLLVFDASRFDEGLMIAVREDINTGLDKDQAKSIVEETLSGYMDMWKREIVTESLEFLVGEYSRRDFEKLMEDTSNKQIKNMVIAYVLEKLEQEGYQFE